MANSGLVSSFLQVLLIVVLRIESIVATSRFAITLSGYNRSRATLLALVDNLRGSRRRKGMAPSVSTPNRSLAYIVAVSGT